MIPETQFYRSDVEVPADLIVDGKTLKPDSAIAARLLQASTTVRQREGRPEKAASYVVSRGAAT